jgi:hypothetical protein
MEHERGAFKVKLPDRPTRLRNSWKFTGSIPLRPLPACFDRENIVPEF